MAKMNGCNSDLPTGSIGVKSTRMNPGKVTRQNLSKGGVNTHLGGTTSKAPKMDRPSGKANMDGKRK